MYAPCILLELWMMQFNGGIWDEVSSGSEADL